MLTIFIDVFVKFTVRFHRFALSLDLHFIESMSFLCLVFKLHKEIVNYIGVMLM